ncbi:MAG: phosphodiester glycosidase family protein [Cyanobacteria bacterium P01_D01_bin.36]
MLPDKPLLRKKVRSLLVWSLAALVACSVGINPVGESADVPDSTAVSPQAQLPTTDYRTYDLPQATVHVVTVNLRDEGISLSMGLADELETVEAIAQRENAIAAINAGFFDPQNGKTTSYLFSQGALVGNPASNERLVNNPDLQRYLSQILNRSELRTYFCKPTADGDVEPGLGVTQYGITFRDAPMPSFCRIDNVWGAGPQLLPTDTSTTEAFTDYENGQLIRDAIGSTQPNARSAVGLTANSQELLLIMVAQRPNAPGLTLTELIDFAKTLGAESLLNLDGGSSSTLYYQGQTHTARLDAEGNLIARPVKSVILVK